MTFTVEIDSSSSEIVLLDADGNDKDVTVIIRDDDKVFIRQECPESNRVDVIEMNWQMLVGLSQSIFYEEGMYHVEMEE